MDDDGDGEIDEGCPCGASEVQRCFSGNYPHRLLGLCRDGEQRCQSEGGEEFGRWGACEGDLLPGDESCNGADDNCDGAIDEGCLCNASRSRACATQLSTGPCSPGTQRCQEDGRWSGCLGAIGPSAELCSDVIDNDCDGLVNEGCQCLPSPEVCGDGVDNDCDLEVDEPACAGAMQCDDGLSAARQIAPLSTSRSTTRRPLLRWVLPSGVTGAAVELCARPDCAAPFERLSAVTEVRPSADLPIGPTFWRVRIEGPGGEGCALSPVWVIFTGHDTGAVDAVQGYNLDVDRDGYPDLLVTSEWRDQSTNMAIAGESILLHGREGGLPLPSGIETLSSTRIRLTLNVGDLDGDGFSEVLLRPSSAGCDIHRGGPEGLRTEVSMMLAPCRTAFGVGDFDGDGYGDLIVNPGGGVPRLVFGGPVLSPIIEVAHTRSISNGWGHAHRAGDLNGDGLGDAMVSITSSEPLGNEGTIIARVYLGNTSRVWGSEVVLETMPRGGIAVADQYAAGDFNGDGYGDLVFAASSSGIRVFEGGPSGISTVPAEIRMLTQGQGTTHEAGDFNGDGFTDAVIFGQLFVGGVGGLRTEALFSFTDSPWSAAAGDLDGDGRDDLIFDGDRSEGPMLQLGAVDGIGSVVSLALDHRPTNSFRWGGGQSISSMADD